MNTRILIASTTGLMLLTSAAFAECICGDDPRFGGGFATGTITDADKCRMLQHDLGRKLQHYTSSPNWADATLAKNEAAQLCQQGKYEDGIAKIEEAFRSIEIKPREE
jgi:hypothetical protein